MKTIHCSVSTLDFGELKGDTIDISNTGLGIQTDYPLKPGYVLRFKEGITDKAGIVKWSTMVDNNYRVGIKFV